jgi:hypothetical protein
VVVWNFNSRVANMRGRASNAGFRVALLTWGSAPALACMPMVWHAAWWVGWGRGGVLDKVII